MRPWFIALAIIGVLNAAVAAYYYLRIVSLMYFREPLAAPRAEGGPGAYVAALLCSLAVLVLGFYPAPLMKGCVEAGKGTEQGARSGEQEARDGEQESRNTDHHVLVTWVNEIDGYSRPRASSGPHPARPDGEGG